jgi:flagellar basal-body rod modification protein FlgD
MAVSPAAATSNSSAATAATSGTASALNLSSGDFMQLLVAQLQNQDPLDPVSDTEFASELAQFATLQGVNTLNTNFSSLLQVQQLAQGINLVGQTVNYTTSGSSSQSSGVVSGITVQNGQLQLEIGTTTVPISQVTGVQPSQTTTAGANN